jgi:hypothetical protein
MTRVLRYFSWRADWWLGLANRVVSRVSFHPSDDSANTEGRQAYALRQSSLQLLLKEHCKKSWHGLDTKLKQGDGAAKDVENLVN